MGVYSQAIKEQDQPMYYTFLSSPIGQLLLAGDEDGLALVEFPEGGKPSKPAADWQRDDKPFRQAKRQLDEYFAGERREFTVTLKPHGTPFQLEVLEALQRIPYGETRSYAEIAREIGRPRAVRAVGAANGRNPLPIIIPCHRVIGSSGSLTGFGGGLPVKRFLLDLERGQPALLESSAASA